MVYRVKSSRNGLILLSIMALLIGNYACSRSPKKATKKKPTSDSGDPFYREGGDPDGLGGGGGGGFFEEEEQRDTLGTGAATGTTPTNDGSGANSRNPTTTTSGGGRDGRTQTPSGGSSTGKTSISTAIAAEPGTKTHDRLMLKWVKKADVKNGAECEYKVEWTGSARSFEVPFRPTLAVSYSDTSEKKCNVKIEHISTKAKEASPLCKK